MTLYDTLGVNRGATQEDIKKAFREKAKKNHEDKGGDKDEMIEINKAYGVLSNVVRRERYDKTGETVEESFDFKFSRYVQQIFMDIVERNDVDYTDLIGEFKGYTKAVIEDNGNRVKDAQKRLKKLDKVKDRLGSSAENRIGLVLEHNIENVKQEIGVIEENIKFMGDCLECLGSYHYNFDIVEQRPVQVFNWGLNDFNRNNRNK